RAAALVPRMRVAELGVQLLAAAGAGEEHNRESKSHGVSVQRPRANSFFVPAMVKRLHVPERKKSLLDECFAANRKWAKAAVAKDPAYFERLEALQNPDLLWIGCSDSRIPANEILGRKPGEVFVHRNVANVVEHTDVNC